LSKQPFSLKIRIGEVEVELGGEKEEVLATLDQLGSIVDKVKVAFGKEEQHRTRSRKPEEPGDTPKNYPNIPRTNQCSEAVTGLLQADWGKTPRSIAELREAMEANAIFFPKTTLSGVLVWLVKKGTIRRFKDKKRGYLYTITVEAP
jgi:hypothetical protein